jgi:hypothetical protein
MKEDIEAKFLHLRTVVESEQFLGKEGLMNEVPFFIFPYSPKEENQVQELSRPLFSTLEKNGVNILEINLFDLCVDLIKERGYWDKLISKESVLKKRQLKDQIQNLTQVDSKIVPAIAKKIEAQAGLQILFITGVGLVYPFIRSHNLLNNLQKVAKDFPTVMLFPGEYTFTEGRGQSLDLFGILNEDKYYRAFNIEEYKLQS